MDRNNANGSRVHLHFKYAENLDFDSSLVTVANDKPIGSKKLTAARANGDELNLEFPKNLEIADSFVLKVAFDLNVKSPEVLKWSDSILLLKIIRMRLFKQKNLMTYYLTTIRTFLSEAVLLLI